LEAHRIMFGPLYDRVKKLPRLLTLAIPTKLFFMEDKVLHLQRKTILLTPAVPMKMVPVADKVLEILHHK